jgi:hypothetical protein
VLELLVRELASARRGLPARRPLDLTGLHGIADLDRPS